MVGMSLGAFPIPHWVWIVAVVGILIQITTLAGPQALRRFRWLPANLLALASSLGAGLLAVALAIALNHAGTDQIDDITISSVIWEVFFYSLFGPHSGRGLQRSYSFPGRPFVASFQPAGRLL